MREECRYHHLAVAGHARAWIVVLPAVALLFALGARPAQADSPPVTFFHFGDADARWVHFTPAPPGDPDTWSIRLLINSSPATCPAPNYVNCPYAGAQLPGVAGPPPATPPGFDFYTTVAGASGGSPRLHMDFSDGGSMELRPLAWVANVWTHEGDGTTASDWDENGGTCGFRYEVTYAVAVACHPGATVTGVIVVTDSSWMYPQYTIDNIRYGNQLITSPSRLVSVRGATATATLTMIGMVTDTTRTFTTMGAKTKVEMSKMTTAIPGSTLNRTPSARRPTHLTLTARP